MEQTQGDSHKSKADAPEGLITSELALGNHCNMTTVRNQPGVTRKCFHDQNQRHPISTSGNNSGSKGRKPELSSKRWWRRRNAEDFPSSSNHHQPSEHLRTLLMHLQTWNSTSTCSSGGQREDPPGASLTLISVAQSDPAVIPGPAPSQTTFHFTPEKSQAVSSFYWTDSLPLS